MPEPIDFYFEFASPYGYFASLRIDAIAANYDRDVVWRPIMLGAAFKEMGSAPTAEIPLKGDYFRRDVPRCARALNVPLKMPPVMPINSLSASRTFYWLGNRDQDIAQGFAQACLHAIWSEGRDMSTVEQVAEVAATLGVEKSDVEAACNDPAIKQRLKDETDASLKRGVFGSPFIFVDGEPFWGADRLNHVERWLSTGGW